MSANAPLALIDCDIFLYEATNVTEHAYHYGNDNWVLSANLGEAKELFTQMVADIKDKLNTPRTLMCISSDSNFRKEINESYKSQRKATRKPIIFPMLKAWVRENYECVTYPKLEADDVMGILSTQPNAGEERIIVSTDKDLQTIPGYLWRQGELKLITKEQALTYWLTQTLTGDPTDGYKGCPGVGAVGAAKILSRGADYGAVEMAFIKAGLTKDDCLREARMARILQWDDWDQEKQTVKLWEPSNGAL